MCMCVHVCMCACVLVYEGPGTVVALVVGWSSEWLSEEDGWLWEEEVRTEWLAQGSSPNVWGRGGNPAATGTGSAGEGEDPFFWGRGPQGRGVSWIWVSEQENASSGCQGVRPVSWVLEWPRRV